MNDQSSGDGIAFNDRYSDTVRYYKKDFWSQENLKFSEPWYRMEKCARLIAGVAQGRQCTLLDIGCGPATLMQLLPPNIEYYGIDIAIHHPAPNLIEADILESPIRFSEKQFDLVIAQGVFEYVGEFQSQKFSEIESLLTNNGRFIVTYTNFSHRREYIYPAFSNVRSTDEFRQDLTRYFNIQKDFPVSHNWKHGHPSRKLLKSANMHLNINIPFISPILAVEYIFVCSPRRLSGSESSHN